MTFEYKKEELELKIESNIYKFRRPSAYEQKELSKAFKNADENTDAVDLYIDFFVAIGIPKEPLVPMSMKGLIDLFEYAVGAKKN